MPSVLRMPFAQGAKLPRWATDVNSSQTQSRMRSGGTFGCGRLAGRSTILGSSIASSATSASIYVCGRQSPLGDSTDIAFEALSP